MQRLMHVVSSNHFRVATTRFCSTWQLGVVAGAVRLRHCSVDWQLSMECWASDHHPLSVAPKTHIAFPCLDVCLAADSACGPIVPDLTVHEEANILPLTSYSCWGQDDAQKCHHLNVQNPQQIWLISPGSKLSTSNFINLINMLETTVS